MQGLKNFKSKNIKSEFKTLRKPCTEICSNEATQRVFICVCETAPKHEEKKFSQKLKKSKKVTQPKMHIWSPEKEKGQEFIFHFTINNLVMNLLATNAYNINNVLTFSKMWHYSGNKW